LTHKGEAAGVLVGVDKWNAIAEYIEDLEAVIESLTRYLAVDLAPKGITVNAVSPGLVRTDAVAAFPVDLKETFDFATSRTPAGRLVTPEDVAHLVAFLCSDAAAMIVGQTLLVDGGYSILA